MSHSNRSNASNHDRCDATATFFDQLKFALEHCTAPSWLGEESPLAQPYFLGQALHKHANAATPLGRGLVLCAELKQAAATLWGGPLPADQRTLLQTATQANTQRGICDQYCYLLLDLTYFHVYFPPARNQAQIYDDILHISRATYDRHLREALQRLGTLLLLRLQPTLRLEQPVTAPELIGRSDLLSSCLKALQTGQTVYLCGPSGMGKSALGAALTERWPTAALFWYTVRLTLNDQLTSLLFALGHFLHQQGASRLWLQLIAGGGALKDANLALALARADLANLAVLPLLCFDEIDLLRPLDIETEMAHHTQFLEFMEGLRGHTPLLLIGQRVVLTSDVTQSLTKLTTNEVATWLTQAGIAFTSSQLERVDAYTAGSPRLLALCLALYRGAHPPSAETFNDVLDQLPQTPALAPIWQRLQRRLDKAARTLLQALAVFRSPIPRDAWTLVADNDKDRDKDAVIQRLFDARLLQEDGRGGLTLLPALRQVIYAQLSLEQREDLHRHAAQIRAARAEYTAAAYHCQRAGQPEEAIAIWQTHRDQEIRRGQAAAALAIFQQISCHRLEPTSAQILLLLRGELYQLCGQPSLALQDVEQIKDQPESLLVEAAIIGGDALRTLGDSDAALTRYNTGLAAGARLIQQTSWLHAKRGTLYLQRRELHIARREALTVRYRLENLEGAIQETAGNYSAARQHYLAAMAAAELLEDKVGLALLQRNLGVLAAHQLDAANAIHHHQQALAFYEEIGDRVRVEEVRSNLAGVYVQFKQFEAALALAQTALTFFQAMQNPYWIAQNTSNLATIYFELGDLAQAQVYAEHTLEQEEPQSYPYALFTLGQIKNAQNRAEEAEFYFARVRQIAEQNEDQFLLSQLQEMVQDQKLIDASTLS